jgi:uncharacterized YccA/Bax inhibitor family protein
MSQLGMTSSNPALSGNAFSGYDQVYGAPRSTTMTVIGTVGKTFGMLAILSFTALWSWEAAKTGSLPPIALPGAAIAGFIIAMITIAKPTFSPFTAPLYAAVEGVFLGAISQMFEKRYPGIATQATMLTIGVTASMLTVYATGIVKVTNQLATGITAATGGIALVYMISIIAGFFGVQLPFIHSTGPIGIAFSVFVVGLAAFNLLLDFEVIRHGAESGAPKYMEWYGAFGLMVTLVWLYMEILRLLSKLSRRD